MLLAYLIDKNGKKEFARSIDTYQVPGDMLTCSSNEATSGIAA